MGIFVDAATGFMVSGDDVKIVQQLFDDAAYVLKSADKLEEVCAAIDNDTHGMSFMLRQVWKNEVNEVDESLQRALSNKFLGWAYHPDEFTRVKNIVSEAKALVNG